MELKHAVFEACDQHKGEWADQGKPRPDYVPDFPAAIAIYHQSCSGNFRIGKKKPKKFVDNEPNIPPKMKKNK